MSVVSQLLPHRPAGGPSRVAFLDRDGTLNVDVDFLRRAADLRLLPGARQAVRDLAAAGFTIVVVTNQSGIARGYLDEKELARIHAALHEALDGVPRAYLHCPHHPDAGGPYGGTCACRKPADGLLRQAVDLLSLPLDDAVLIGDSARDLAMASELPLCRIHVQSGKPAASELAQLHAAGITPACSVPDLRDAVAWLRATARA